MGESKIEFRDVGLIVNANIKSDWELDLTVRFIHSDSNPINIMEKWKELEKMMKACKLWDICIKSKGGE